MLHNRKAAPSDRLADGSTLLHELLRSSSYLQDSRYLYALRDFAFSLIDAGVPVAEKTLDGDSVADEVLLRMSHVHLTRGMPNPVGQLLKRLFLSGSELASLAEVPYLRRLYHIPQPLHGFWYRKTALVQSLCLQNMLGDIQFSPLQMAIVTKSEEGLRESLLRTNDGFSTSPPYTPGFGTLLAWCLGWIPGMMLVLESPLPQNAYSISSCFDVACLNKDIESASLLLDHNPEITLHALRSAVHCRDRAVLKTAISLLAAQRHALQEMALHHLAAEHIRSLELPESGLLDTKTRLVYDALVRQGIKSLPCVFPEVGSVYSALRADIPAAELLYVAELLYAAGFTDLNQRCATGITEIGYMRLYSGSLVSFATMADWMISRGADLYIPSRHGYPAIFYVAGELGSGLGTVSYKCHKKSCLHGSTSSCELGTILSTHVSVVDLISTVLSDGITDDCLCACSGRGCSPLTQLLKAYHNSNRLWMIGHLQEIVSRTLNTDCWKTTVSAIVRYLTFEALEMTHTCHITYTFGVRCLDSEETCEIRDEESAMIVQLDELMVEFDRKYDELDVGIRQFLEGYWHTRMDEVLQEQQGISPDESMKVREIGVILSDADYSSSDDGED
ncbi:uncharacterized protein APUU_31295A [Aspergillus puulaauensis]|uniref:Uncharacterized protein n=1 Tax=Aspergillus puulaauensis TaxID=1220207 RepID=A0A7R7XKK6_9EURO|nr:uncharacterized protein APUU_31295A [Aspergillus puulaauensis]BCS23070.1 hypothetical protein APUU_31295A [Aspergillus puulaauensis]